jgi:hypothetical protein
MDGRHKLVNAVFQNTVTGALSEDFPDLILTFIKGAGDQDKWNFGQSSLGFREGQCSSV